MKLDQKEIKEFQEILVEEYGKKLTLNQVESIAKNLISLYSTVLNKNINKDESKWIQTDPSK
jgi:flagellin-specific chaperone FliS